MAITPIENLKGFAASRPPLIVFMVCLSGFAVVLMSLGYMIKSNEIQNPDLSEDWNMFLESFSSLEFCITGNASEPAVTSPPTALKQVSSISKKLGSSSALTTTTPLGDIRNFSISLLMTVEPTQNFLRIPHNVTHLYGSVAGYQLGLKGDAAQEEMNVTFALPYEWNRTKCDGAGKCDPVRIYTCVNFQAPSSVFPITRKPQMCYGVNETGVDYHAHVEAHKGYAFFKYYHCRQQTKISVRYNINPALTVMLSIHDRSLINLHLMHTSYFLFVMVITLICYAIIKGKPSRATKYNLVQNNENHNHA